MTKKLLILFALFLSVFCILKFLPKTKAQTTPTTISGKFYKFETVAEFPNSTLFPYRSNVSINDFGTVALSGRTPSSPEPYEQIFVRGFNESLRAITNPPAQNQIHRRFSSIQINNTNQVLSQTEDYSGTSNARIHIWNGNAVESNPYRGLYGFSAWNTWCRVK